MAKVTRAAIYARVSTRHQAEKHGTDYQVQALTAYAEAREWLVYDSFTDEGYSGLRKDRPGLRFLWQAVRQRKVDVVLVWRFDRFARSLPDLVNALAEFEALGVQFVSLTEQMDTGTPLGRALFAVAGAMAQLERDLARERVQAGVDAARARGTQLGRRREVLVSLEDARTAYAQHKGLRPAARALGISKTSLAKLLATGATP